MRHRISGVRIVGIAAAVPLSIESLSDLERQIPDFQSEKVAAVVGVRQRRIDPDLTTLDLAYAAARKLLDDMAIDEIDAILFVSQTPDFWLPASSCILQHRLGLGKATAALDINLGCSGYTHGLWVAASLIAGGGAKHVLLLAGDTISKLVASDDSGTAPVFGDAATATLLEAGGASDSMGFVLGTDGSGASFLTAKSGGFRALGRTKESGKSELIDRPYLQMDGAEVFSFSLREVPPLIEQILEEIGWDRESTDQFVFHQANRFMLNHLQKKMKLPSEKCVLGLENFGNTSSASIPLAMVTELSVPLRTQSQNLILAGFGVGFSWSAVAVTTDKITVCDLVEVA